MIIAKTKNHNGLVKSLTSSKSEKLYQCYTLPELLVELFESDEQLPTALLCRS